MSHPLALRAPHPEQAWIVPGIIPQQELVFLDGDAGIGKTNFLACVAKNLSRYPTEQTDRPISFLCSPRQREMLTIFLDRYRPDYDCLHEMTFTADPQLTAQQHTQLNYLARQINEHLSTVKPMLLIIDSIDELLENTIEPDMPAWKLFWALLHDLAHRYHCTILLPRQQGLHQNRQYGSSIRTGTEAAHFILSLLFHPNDPGKRIITIAKNQLGPVGNQYTATFNHDCMSLFRLNVVDYVRPARSLSIWLPNRKDDEQNLEILETVEQFLGGLPKKCTDVYAHLKQRGYTPKQYERALLKAKMQPAVLKETMEKCYFPDADMTSRFLHGQDTPLYKVVSQPAHPPINLFNPLKPSTLSVAPKRHEPTGDIPQLAG